MYKINIAKSAIKELDEISSMHFAAIDKAILALKKEPRPHPQSKKLKNQDMRRLRVGDYRVIYVIDERAKAIRIVHVRHRKEAYRW